MYFFKEDEVVIDALFLGSVILNESSALVGITAPGQQQTTCPEKDWEE